MSRLQAVWAPHTQLFIRMLHQPLTPTRPLHSLQPLRQLPLTTHLPHALAEGKWEAGLLLPHQSPPPTLLSGRGQEVQRTKARARTRAIRERTVKVPPKGKLPQKHKAGSHPEQQHPLQGLPMHMTTPTPVSLIGQQRAICGIHESYPCPLQISSSGDAESIPSCLPLPAINGDKWPCSSQLTLSWKATRWMR